MIINKCEEIDDRNYEYMWKRSCKDGKHELRFEKVIGGGVNTIGKCYCGERYYSSEWWNTKVPHEEIVYPIITSSTRFRRR